MGVGDYFFVYSDFVFASTNVSFYRFRMGKIYIEDGRDWRFLND